MRDWIDAGAVWPEASPARSATGHWAFRAPVRPADCAAAAGAPALPVDAFVRARLAQEGLQPSSEATTLLRRLHFDLIGLPPTPTEVEAFVGDSSVEAYGKAVERLLAPPHYGERWGRHSLDAARGTPTAMGSRRRTSRVLSRVYRDWVVSAFNRDLPYDRLVIEQIAGDLLPGATPGPASGYRFSAKRDAERGGWGGPRAVPDGSHVRPHGCHQKRAGLTIQCAQCHSHKFDPLQQEEYYRRSAYLNNDHESSGIAYTRRRNRCAAPNLRREMQDLEAGLRHRTPDWERRMAEWEEATRTNQTAWAAVPHVNTGDNGERFYYYADGSVRAASYAPTQWTAHFRGDQQPAVHRRLPPGATARSESSLPRSRPFAARLVCPERVQGDRHRRRAAHQQGRGEVPAGDVRLRPGRTPIGAGVPSRRTGSATAATSASTGPSNTRSTATATRRGASMPGRADGTSRQAVLRAGPANSVFHR